MTTVKRITGFVLIMLLAGMFPARELRAMSPEEIAEGVQQYYKSIKDLEAYFHQSSFLPMMNQSREASGKIYLKLPGKMRWDYETGPKKSVIINENRLWFYDIEEKQLTISDLDQMPNSQSLLTFITGMGDLKKFFHFVAGPPDEKTDKRFAYLRLVPKEENSQWTYLQLLVDTKTFRVVQTGFEGIQGDRTLIGYENIRTNVGLKDDLFLLDVAPDTDILHYPPLTSTPKKSGQ